MTLTARIIVVAAGALLLAGTAIASDDDTAQDQEPERTAMTDEQRREAWEARREAVRKLPPEQRAAVREAHRKSMTPEERAEHRQWMQDREHGGCGKGKQQRKRHHGEHKDD